MEEIGCHFKFEILSGSAFHNTNLMLSSGRNCLRYIIRERNIETLYLPYFLCESLKDVAEKEKVEIIFYHIDDEFLPSEITPDMLSEKAYLYFVNYYGILTDKIDRIIDLYKFVIVDDTHNFFDTKLHDADVIFNYRKYFGVPDGACILSQDLVFNPEVAVGTSLNKIIEIVSRDETGEFFHYPTFYEADKYFQNEDLCYMSNFTRNYVNAIDYNAILKKRLINYRILLEELSKYNGFQLFDKELNYMFPLLVSDGDSLRDHLKKNNIYSQKLWPNVVGNGSNNEEVNKASNVVLLPIDQRYSTDDMIYISRIVHEHYKNGYSRMLVR